MSDRFESNRAGSDRGRSGRDDRNRGGQGNRDHSPRNQRDDRSRREGSGYQGRNDGPRREGGYQGRNDGPRREGGYQGRSERPARDGEKREWSDRPKREGGYQGRSDGPRREGGYQGRNDGPRREGGYQGRDARSERSGQDLGRGGTRGGGRSDRGGADREFTEAERLAHELRPVRAEHFDPEIPDDVRAKDLHPSARNELKTLQEAVQERVARHLAMVGQLIDTDPELAHQHAISASRRAGRIPVARETLAVTAYRTGDFALALRELRTYRRLSGSHGHLALMVDCERGLGRPEKAIETGLDADAQNLDTEQRVLLAIAMSGARLDLGQKQQALFELEIPELDPKRAYSWSPDLFTAYANVLEDLGREAEAATWRARAAQADAALQEHYGTDGSEEVFQVWEEPGEANSDTYDAERHEAEAEAEAEAENVEVEVEADLDTEAVSSMNDAAESGAEFSDVVSSESESEDGER